MSNMNQQDLEAAQFLAHCRDDPVLFVEKWWPWGEKGTRLENKKGPRKWQMEFLEALREDVQARDVDALRASGEGIRAIKYSVVSGHASGKSALLSWVALWLFETRPMSVGSMTSTTAQQMRGRFFRELGIWRGMMRTAHLSRITMGMSPKLVRIGYENDWKLEGYAPKKELSEAFAGQHSADSASYYIFDEASGVDDEFYRVAQGGLMDSEPFVFACGNGTRASGFFYRSHHQRETDDPRDRNWRTFRVNSLDVEGINRDEIMKMIEEFGASSDTVNVRIYGGFPNKSDFQFFPTDMVDYCSKMEVVDDPYAPYIMGVDIAHSGADRSVICVRKGRNARNAAGPLTWYSCDTNSTDELANKIAQICSQLARQGKPVRRVCVESLGVGAGVWDALKRLEVPGLTNINPGARSNPGTGAYNKRAECYVNLRKAMSEGLAIPDTTHQVVGEHLRDELLGTDANPHDDGTYRMDSKKDIRKKVGRSPDFADALALTYGVPLFTTDHPYGVDWERQLMHNRNEDARTRRNSLSDVRDYMRGV